MQFLDEQPRTALADATYIAHTDTHYPLLTHTIPHWLGNASSARRLALKSARPLLTNRLRAAPTAQHAELVRLNAAHWTAQNRIDRTLENLQDAHAFAEPLLKNALKARFGLDLDVKGTFLRLYLPLTIPWFPIKSGAARTWTVSLLNAALHNFEEHETHLDAYEPDSTFITEPSSTGQFDTLPALKRAITIHAFTRLCRELDIGGQYRTHLEEHLGISNPLVAAVLRSRIEASQKAALKAALHLARMNGDIQDDFLQLIQGLADGSQNIKLGNDPLLCHDLTIMSAKMTGIVVFAPNLERSRNAARIVAYIPDDPDHPIKEYSSTAELMKTLTRQLRTPDYQEFFSRFVAHEDRGHFFGKLADRLSQVTWHQRPFGEALPSWRETPIERPNLQFSVTPIHRGPWPHLYREQLNKILNDARVIAVSTAMADQKARWALWDSFTGVLSAIVQIGAFVALPFVPFLGELMLAYMAYQLVNDAFEGIIDWAQGQTIEAFEHLMTVVETVIQLGAFAAGGVIAAGEFRKALPAEVVAFIDRFKAVQAANGKTLYWKPDLSPYERTADLPQHSAPDTAGLHQHNGKTLVRIEGKPFAVSQDATGDYRIEHPSRRDAYRPALKNNGSGAWQTELDRPLEWDKHTLLQRLGHLSEKLSTAERERALKASGLHVNTLRKMHVEHEPMPSLLADTLKRLNIDKDLQTFIDHLGSEHHEQYSKADFQTQLQLLTDHFLWPDSTGLSLLDAQGNIVWETTTPARSGIEVQEGRLADGDLLKTLLANLNETEQKILLEENRNSPPLSLSARAATLRQKLAQTAARQRTSLFDSRYRALERTQNALLQKLLDTTTGLPLSVATELMDTATGSELRLLQTGEVPKRLKDLARWAMQEVRLTRAYEGLDLPSQENPDTDLLRLHSLERLPGWTSDVRIDVQDYSYEGHTRARIGKENASIRKVLVRREDGRYEAYDDEGSSLSGATDLNQAILHALPDTERNALNINTYQGEKLHQALRDHPLERNELRDILEQNPIPKPAYDPTTMRLLGGADGYDQLPSGQPDLVQRVRQLYPALNPEEVQEVIEHLHTYPAGAHAELARLHGEYTQLSHDLSAWANRSPHLDPQTGNRLSVPQLMENRENRIAFRTQMLRGWRRQITAGITDNAFDEVECLLSSSKPLVGELPTITADFSRISTLSITNSGTPQGIMGFLQHFTGLTRLELRNIALGELPPALSNLPKLNQLLLTDCGIILTPDTQATLSSFSNLVTLDLGNNPLSLAPNLQGMPELNFVDLSNTGISSMPEGLLGHQSLRTAILNDNQITDLAPGFFNLPARISQGMDFGNNPFSLASREQIKNYFQRTRQDFGVMAVPAEIDRIQALYPLLDREEASDFIYQLPGNLEAGRVELTRLETEYTTLRNDLAAWTSDVPAVHPQTGQPFTNTELTEEHWARDAFKETVEECWRRESDLEGINAAGEPHYEFFTDEIINGDLPQLTADFSHVSRLQMDGDDNVTSRLDGFLRCFPNLRSLTISDYALSTIPESVFHMGELTTLALTDCLITLTPQTQAALAGMENIEHLVLGGNPLSLPADISQMPRLKTLMLYDTGIREIPPGLLSRTTLRVANLSDNAISEIPSDILELPADVAMSIKLSGNPFSEESLQLFIAYFRRTGVSFNIEDVVSRAEIEVSSSENSEVDE
jgi:Leucine-rich repeat (LRR) protein